MIEEAGLRSLAHRDDRGSGATTSTLKTSVLVIGDLFSTSCSNIARKNFFRDVEGTALIIPDLLMRFSRASISDAKTRFAARSPTTGVKKKLIRDAEGFIYAAAVNAVTGSW